MSGAGNLPDGFDTRAGRYLDAPIGAARKPRGVRWRRLLVLFMRMVACIWLLKGLLHWIYILGLGDPGFPDLRLSRQGIIMLFAVLDLVAAVGLWLASSWGAAVWLMVLLLEATIPFLVPDMAKPITDSIAALIFGFLYLYLALKALRDDQSA